MMRTIKLSGGRTVMAVKDTGGGRNRVVAISYEPTVAGWHYARNIAGNYAANNAPCTPVEIDGRVYLEVTNA